MDCHPNGNLFWLHRRRTGADMATHMVKVREDLLQKLIGLSQETGKPISDLVAEVLDWARQQSQLQQSQASRLRSKTG
jgi:hypothetical protein